MSVLKSFCNSRTIKAAALIAALGVVEVNFHLLKVYLGDYYGLSFLVISAVMAALRVATTKPLNGK